MLSFACKDRRVLQDNQHCDQHLKYMPPKYRLSMLFFFSFEFYFVAGGSVIFLLLLIIIIAITPFGTHEELTHLPGVDEHFKIAYTSCGRVEG
jgi:hypothetical protein